MPGCDHHGHQLGAIEKTADEVDLSKRVQGPRSRRRGARPGVPILVVPAHIPGPDAAVADRLDQP